MKIVPVVEGEGEVKAVPVLLRRMIALVEAFESIQVGRPIRKPRNQLTKREGIVEVLKLARIQGADSVLCLFDSDGECPVDLAERLLNWAREEAADLDCHVVVAHQEYEAWFLASIPSLRAHAAMRDDAECHPNPEGRHGAKEQLHSRMQIGSSYSPTAHQAAFSDTFDMASAYAHCRSFRKLTSAFGRILSMVDPDDAHWPPKEWSDSITPE